MSKCPESYNKGQVQSATDLWPAEMKPGSSWVSALIFN